MFNNSRIANQRGVYVGLVKRTCVHLTVWLSSIYSVTCGYSARLAISRSRVCFSPSALSSMAMGASNARGNRGEKYVTFVSNIFLSGKVAVGLAPHMVRRGLYHASSDTRNI